MTMQRVGFGLVLGLGLAVFACSSEDTDGSTSSSSGSPSTGSTSGSSSSNTSSSSGGSKNGSNTSSSGSSGGATDISSPTITAVNKMMGALHVKWTNPDPECENIEIERQAEMPDGTIHEKYEVVFTVPGTADNKHDTTATDDMKYSYRLRCKNGSKYSSYSDVKSGNPTE